MFSLFHKAIFTTEEKQRIVQAIRNEESRTSGEIRLYIERHCDSDLPLEQAIKVFQKLKMHRTKYRNAVVLYIAMVDKKCAIFGDTGIHDAVGGQFWEKEIETLISYFQQEQYVDGIIACINEIGSTLHEHFPYEPDSKNELPDDIVFGKN